MKLTSWDLETHLIKPGMVAPRPVCLSWHDGAQGTVLDRDAAGPWLAAALVDPSLTLVGHNIAYDAVVAMAEWPALVAPFFLAYEAGRVRCTEVRQHLIDIERGEHKFRASHLKTTRADRSLAALSLHHLGEHLEKADTPRLTYGDLDGAPIDDWPAEAVTYALRDAEVTRRVFVAQSLGRDTKDVSPDETNQTQAALALQLMSAWGVRTDGPRVAQLRDFLETSREVATAHLIPTGILRADGSRDMKVLQDRVAAAYEVRGRVAPRTPRSKKFPQGQVQYGEEQLLDSGDPDLLVLGNAMRGMTLLNNFVPRLEGGTAVPICAHYNVLVESGRTSCDHPNMQNPPRMGGVRECFIARPGTVFSGCDYDVIELRALAQVCLDLLGWSAMADAFQRGADPHLEFAAQIEGISSAEAVERYRAGDRQIADARQLAKCFHPDTEVLTRRGWKKIPTLTSGEEVVQAIPMRGEIKLQWVVPLEVFTKRHPAEELIHLKNEGIDLRVTPDHRMLGFRADGAWDVTTPCELRKFRAWGNAGRMQDDGRLSRARGVDDLLLRLAVATQADGSYARGGHQIRFGFTKQRKIERLIRMLDGIDGWRRGKASKMATFLFDRVLAEKVKALLEVKRLPWWWLDLSERQREIVLEEAEFWDSHRGPRSRAYTYSTAEEQNANVLQAIASITGRKSRKIKERGKYFKVTVRRKWHSRGENLSVTSQRFTGEVACLSVPSSFVLVRDGGVPVVCGQTANFGFPGGLSAESFVAYAHGYDERLKAIVTPAVAERLRAAWFERWPEMNKYFDRVGGMVGRYEAPITQLWSGRVRGACGFTQACNTYFQGLTADGAKRAAWALARECYLGEWSTGGGAGRSPLLGSRPVIFMHDEFILEVPEDRASEAADRQAAVMRTAMQSVMPDVPVTCGPVLMRRWYKGARPVRVDGRLLPSKPTQGADGRTIWEVDL